MALLFTYMILAAAVLPPPRLRPLLRKRERKEIKMVKAASFSLRLRISISTEKFGYNCTERKHSKMIKTVIQILAILFRYLFPDVTISHNMNGQMMLEMTMIAIVKMFNTVFLLFLSV